MSVNRGEVEVKLNIHVYRWVGEWRWRVVNDANGVTSTGVARNRDLAQRKAADAAREIVLDAPDAE